MTDKILSFEEYTMESINKRYKPTNTPHFNYKFKVDNSEN